MKSPQKYNKTRHLLQANDTSGIESLLCIFVSCSYTKKPELSHNNQHNDRDVILAPTTSSILQQSGGPTLVQGSGNQHTLCQFLPHILCCVSHLLNRGYIEDHECMGEGFRGEDVCMLLRAQMGKVSQGCMRVRERMGEW